MTPDTPEYREPETIRGQCPCGQPLIARIVAGKLQIYSFDLQMPLPVAVCPNCGRKLPATADELKDHAWPT